MMHERISRANQPPAKTILLVDDEFLVTEYYVDILETHGFRVLTAASGKDAIEITRHTSALDLILTDITLCSGMDGTETAQQILAQRNLPILFLSRHTGREVVEKIEKITSYGYVVKNSGAAVLLTSINMAFKLFAAHQQSRQAEASVRESERQLRELNAQKDKFFSILAHELRNPISGGSLIVSVESLLSGIFRNMKHEGSWSSMPSR